MWKTFYPVLIIINNRLQRVCYWELLVRKLTRWQFLKICTVWTKHKILWILTNESGHWQHVHECHCIIFICWYLWQLFVLRTPVDLTAGLLYLYYSLNVLKMIANKPHWIENKPYSRNIITLSRPDAPQKRLKVRIEKGGEISNHRRVFVAL